MTHPLARTVENLPELSNGGRCRRCPPSGVAGVGQRGRERLGRILCLLARRILELTGQPLNGGLDLSHVVGHLLRPKIERLEPR